MLPAVDPSISSLSLCWLDLRTAPTGSAALGTIVNGTGRSFSDGAAGRGGYFDRTRRARVDPETVLRLCDGLRRALFGTPGHGPVRPWLCRDQAQAITQTHSCQRGDTSIANRSRRPATDDIWTHADDTNQALLRNRS